jgi:hypothetical protein
MITEKLNKVGKIIAVILVGILLIQFLIVWLRDCQYSSEEKYEPSTCIQNLVFLVIPTEVTIAEIFQSSPFILLLVLLFYIKFVAPHLNN